MERKIKLKLSINRLNLLIYAFFLYPVYTSFLMIFFPSWLIVIFGNLIILLFFLLYIKNKGIKKDILFIYLTTILFFILNSLRNSSYLTLYLDSHWGFLAIYGLHTGIFGYTLIRNIDNFNQFEIIIKKISFILMIFYCIQCLEPLLNTYWIINGEKMVYNMDFGYSIQFPIIFMIYFYLKEKKIIYLILSVLGTVAIILFGSRGPLIGIILYGVIQFVLYKKKNRMIRLIITCIVMLLMVLIIMDGSLIKNILSFLAEKGIVSRTLSKLVNNLATDDTGRNIIRHSITNLFNYNGILFGYGPLGDQILTGYYSHNLILEILVTFGLLLGPILIFVFTFFLIFSFIKSKGTILNNYLIIFLCLSIPKLFLSSSFWRESFFWILMGMIVNTISKNKS